MIILKYLHCLLKMQVPNIFDIFDKLKLCLLKSGSDEKDKDFRFFHELSYLFLNKKYYLNKALAPLSHIDLKFALIPSKKLSIYIFLS